MEAIILNSISGNRTAHIEFSREQEQSLIKKLQSIGINVEVRKYNR